MSDPLRVLMLEDRLDDAELVLHHLRRGGFAPDAVRVDNEADYLAALEHPADIILADYHLPQYDGIQALEAMIARGLDIPFIIVSGAIGEERAVAAIQLGAADYIIKDRMARLGSAVRSALQARQLRDAHHTSEEALRATRERHSRIVETAAEGIAIVDERGIITFANERAVTMLGLDLGEVVGQPWREFVDDPGSTAVQADVERARSGTRVQMDLRLLRRDGAEMWALASVAPTISDDGSLVSLVMLMDITDRKRSEEDLNTFHTAIEQSPVGIVIADADGRVEYVNPHFQKMTGYTGADMSESSPAALVSPETVPEDAADMWEAVGRGRVWHGEFRNRRKDGVPYWEAASIAPVTGADGGITHVIAVKQDVTREKEDQAQIRRQFERIAALRAIDVTINGTLDVQITLRLLLEQLPVLLGVDTATVLLLSPLTHTLSTTAWYGLRSEIAAPRSDRLGDGCAGRAALERCLVSLRGPEDPACTPADAALLRAEGAVRYHAVPLIAKGVVKGVLELFQRSHGNPERDWTELLGTLAAQAATAIDNAAMFDNLQRANAELALAYDATLEGWSRAVDLRDRETEGHSQRVAVLSIRIADRMGMPAHEQVHLRRGALLHDIGKLGVPDNILLKPAALTDDEWQVMRLHPVYAYEMLSPIRFLSPAIDVPYCHHERWDGSGYPRGLRGNAIPLAARIFALVDVYDALTSDRPYRAAWDAARAREHVAGLSGTHFDPAVVDAFLALVE